MKQVFYFYGYRLRAFHWKSGQIVSAQTFEPDPKGFAAFHELLRRGHHLTTYMLLDLIEEEFRTDSIPRAYGGDRKALIKRAMNKAFGDMTHRTSISQGFEKNGKRRDEQLLMASLTNPDLIKPWLDILKKFEVSLAGVYSVPIVGQGLAKSLKWDKSYALVVTQQVPWTLRQSFYALGKLKFSRLIPTRIEGLHEYPNHVFTEIDNTTKFLQYKRILPPGKTLDVKIITASEYANVIAAERKTAATASYEILTVEEVATKIGMRGEMSSPFADSLFTHLLLKQRFPTNHYAQAADQFFYHSHQVKRRLHLASIAVGLFGVALAGKLIIDGMLYEQHSATAHLETQRYQNIYQQRLETLEEDTTDAEIMKQTVDVMEILSRDATPKSHQLLATLSTQLSKQPAIELLNLSWRYEIKEDEISGARDARYPTPIINLEARVKTEETSYRSILDQMNELVEGLKAKTAIHSVNIIKPVIDTSPISEFRGESGTAVVAANASTANRFIIEIVFRNNKPSDNANEG